MSLDHGDRLTDSISLPLADDPAPDWAAAGADIVCPLCDYNLRGLTDPRCPECGYQFQWHDLIDPNRRVHPYIFEHHPRRNIWSFVRTAIGGLRPWKFWASLRPDQTSRPRRLIAYWAVAMLIVLLLLVLDCAAISVERIAAYNAYRSPSIPISVPAASGPYARPIPARRSYFDWYPYRRTLVLDGPGLLACWVACLAWPWLTLAILMIFRVSMSRAKVKTEHVLRSVLYSGDAFLWPAALVAATFSIEAGLIVAGLIDQPVDWYRSMALAVAILCVFPAIKLWAAYQRYLRFPHALATIVASQLILFLAALAALTNIAYYLH